MQTSSNEAASIASCYQRMEDQPKGCSTFEGKLVQLQHQRCCQKLIHLLLLQKLASSLRLHHALCRCYPLNLQASYHPQQKNQARILIQKLLMLLCLFLKNQMTIPANISSFHLKDFYCWNSWHKEPKDQLSQCQRQLSLTGVGYLRECYLRNCSYNNF